MYYKITILPYENKLEWAKQIKQSTLLTSEESLCLANYIFSIKGDENELNIERKIINQIFKKDIGKIYSHKMYLYKGNFPVWPNESEDLKYQNNLSFLEKKLMSFSKEKKDEELIYILGKVREKFSIHPYLITFSFEEDGLKGKKYTFNKEIKKMEVISMLKNRYKISSKKGLEIFNNLNQLDEYKKYFTHQEIIDITDVDPEREPLLFIEYKNMDFYTENDYIQEILKLLKEEHKKEGFKFIKGFINQIKNDKRVLIY
jgi:hypothetical protein